MSAVRTTAAAAMLGVSPSTLRSWERRFGFPVPRRSEGGHRQFDLEDVEALRGALAECESLAAAVAVARQRGTGPASPARLRDAVERFDGDACDRLVEESLALRSLERTVDEVVLPGVQAVIDRCGELGAEHGFAFRWAAGWLAATTRACAPASRADGVLLFDASAPPELDALAVAGLELALRRRGVPVLALAAASHPERLARAVRAVRPAAVVLAGRHVALDDVGRLVHAVRRAEDGIAVLHDFRGPIPDTGASTVARLPATPVAAAAGLLAVLEAPRALAARA